MTFPRSERSGDAPLSPPSTGRAAAPDRLTVSDEDMRERYGPVVPIRLDPEGAEAEVIAEYARPLPLLILARLFGLRGPMVGRLWERCPHMTPAAPDQLCPGGLRSSCGALTAPHVVFTASEPGGHRAPVPALGGPS